MHISYKYMLYCTIQSNGHTSLSTALVVDYIRSIGAIPSFQTALHTVAVHSTYPAVFIFSIFIPTIPGAFPVFADFSDSSTSDRSISG